MTTRVSHILGTIADVCVGGVSERRASKLEQAVVDEIRRLESIFTLFDPASAINQLRARGSTESAELIQVLELAEHWRVITADGFNPCVEGLRSLWQEAEASQQVPSQAMVSAAVAEIAGAHMVLRHLNLNAIAKGWIVDQAIQATLERKRSPKSCWVSIGGDVAHRGPDSIAVGIEDPFRPFDNAAPIATVQLTNQALATSGGARRFWTIASQTFSHVIDPGTGWPVDHVASASVIAADAASADVLATAATVLSIGESLQVVEATPGAACLIVAADKTRHTSADWPS